MLAPKDPEREAVQYKRMNDLAIQYGLDPEFAESYPSAVITRVVKNHEEIANNS
jgi:chorismate mutase